MFKKYSRNMGIRGISILLALVLWLFVIGQIDAGTPPEYTRTIPSMPLEMVGTQPEFNYSLYPSSVDVVIEGSQQIIGEQDALSPELTVEVANLSPGVHNIEVSSRIAGGNIRSISPRWVTVVVEEVITHQMDISVKSDGESPLGELEELELEVTDVTIEGPMNNVERVTEVVALVDLSQIQQSQIVDVPLRALNIYGERVQGVSLSPSSVAVNVTLDSTLQQSQQDIEVENPPEDYEYEISPSRVVVQSVDEENLEDITAFVDLQDLDPGEHKLEVQISSPNDIDIDELIIQPENIKATIID
ncbi:CdaR family protein [Proteinivorax hydrogeniformans]|uniref:CdaR family protein n=1 Tax=Proteinivorax hydrogeniformans TaxID=1826727 RepID=A0AAU8HU82_9FIRM